MSGATTRGVLFVHSAPRALVPHIEWAAGGVLGVRASFDWTSQPIAPGCLRAEYSWQAPQGTGALLASALRGWAHLRFEVTEEPSQGCDGGRWSHTPAARHLPRRHGRARQRAGARGPRARRHGPAQHGDAAGARRALALAVGEAWDCELEAFRHAGDDTPVRWLHQVG